MTKPVILSSSGLKNIVLTQYQEEDFIFVFGKEEFRMKSIFADFISPVVSRIHKSDPTINTINLEEINSANTNCIKEQSKMILTPDIISLLGQISSGNSIEINEDQSIKMRFLSKILGNEELNQKLIELFPPKINEKNINILLKNIEINPDFDIDSVIFYASNIFYLLDHEEFLKLPRKIQYKIISHHNLQIESEDILFDIISQIIKKRDENENDEIDDILFLEQINFAGLSEKNIRSFISEFNINDMSGQLWRNICQCFFPHSIKQSKRITDKLYKYQKYEYDGDESNALNGIIKNLTKKSNGKKEVIATSSSVFGVNWHAKNALNFDSLYYFCTENKENSWIEYDFGDKKVHSTHYTIRSEPNDPGFSHLMNWVVEGSNQKDNWKVLDSRNGVTSLNSYLATQTFEIQEKLEENEYYRYLRIRQTGLSAKDDNVMTMSALEYFGILRSPISK